MKIFEHPALSTLLLPLAGLYGLAVRSRNARFSRGLGIRTGPIPVVSVGNLTVGGTGKTPLAARLARELLALGRHPAIVSRGYGGRAGRGPVVVGAGSGPVVPVEVSGDEPFMLASRLSGVPVLVGADRRLGVEEARRSGADIAILDDGFQHRRLHRDLDIVVVDAERPFGNGRLLPAGPLREPPSALERADLVVRMGSPGTSDREPSPTIRDLAPGAVIVSAWKFPLGFFTPDGRPAEIPLRAHAFCGIGSPGSFRRDLEALGVRLDAFYPKGDHHRFTPAEILGLWRAVEPTEAVLVTTEKDLARLSSWNLPAGLAARLRVLRVEVRFGDDGPVRSLLARTVGMPGPC